MVNPVAVAVPVFFALIGVEAAYARARGLQIYRLNDALTDLGCGVTDQVGGVFVEGALLGIYAWVLANFRVVALAPSLGLFLAASLGVDLSYYLWHRASHRVNFIWATHVVHHQSDEYNLAVALRQAVFAGLTAWPFYLWLAVLGVPIEIYAGARAFNLLYQFWIHTRVVGRLGPLEWILNTPSHHRVHHGVNARYIDKNYAGVLIIWDRMFGTFEPEVEPVIYGTVSPYGSWNPLWAQVDYWVKLAKTASSAPRWSDKLKVWFMPPEWTPAGEPPAAFPPDEALAARPRYDVDAPQWHAYIAVQWVGVAVATVGLLLFAHEVPWAPLVPLRPLLVVAVALWTWGSLAVFAGLLEGKSWARGAEGARQGALLIGGAGLAGWLGVAPIAIAAAIPAVASASWMAAIARGQAVRAS